MTHAFSTSAMVFLTQDPASVDSTSGAVAHDGLAPSPWDSHSNRISSASGAPSRSTLHSIREHEEDLSSQLHLISQPAPSQSKSQLMAGVRRGGRWG